MGGQFLLSLVLLWYGLGALAGIFLAIVLLASRLKGASPTDDGRQAVAQEPPQPAAMALDDMG